MPRRSGPGGGGGSGAAHAHQNYYQHHHHRHLGYAAHSDVHLRALFQDFNAPKFVVFTCLLVFAMLFALKLDGVLPGWSWWAIFVPLWVWKGIAVTGAVVGSYVWWRRPQSRLNAEEYIQYKAMLISLATHLLLLMFELLLADNLNTRRHLWILVFVPLVFISIVSISICVWSVRHDRSFEMELFCAVNVLQFVFLALKLDGLITWPWEITFVPLWIVLCVSLVGVLYTIIFAGILLRLPEVNTDQRRSSTNSALGYSFLVIPLLVFLVLLTHKLDGSIGISYFSAFTPLYLTFFTLVVTSFGTRGGNQYWFGLRKPPCQFLFSVCPCLQLFGNISYSLYSNRESNAQGQNSTHSQSEISVVESLSSSSTGTSSSLSPTSSSPSGWSAITRTNKKDRKMEQIVAPALAIEMPD
ncbi:transmembrane protein 185B-like [Tigriopus californicus]|uniref:transmembrane protein 185B-like n=1 Tax=Tigriopus californicus TaxID=6832 RepID=UPI0027DA755B|nr:transmembrane protein 185B-like [Tigriopus californicus]|eukprot:TCALIF_00695-PA protein Name:"Similar to TMEM185B Transmembrane protein 185B (Homo sapiens)" AED:0.06 eAED:0.06 QI:250/1/1/1/0.75/0.6/5/423/412